MYHSPNLADIGLAINPNILLHIHAYNMHISKTNAHRNSYTSKQFYWQLAYILCIVLRATSCEQRISHTKNFSATSLRHFYSRNHTKRTGKSRFCLLAAVHSNDNDLRRFSWCFGLGLVGTCFFLPQLKHLSRTTALRRRLASVHNTSIRFN